MTSNSDTHTETQAQTQQQQLRNQNQNYPPPTALYRDLTRDANLFTEKLQSFHKSFGTKLK